METTNETRLKSGKKRVFKQNERSGTPIYRGSGYHPQWCFCRQCLPEHGRPVPPVKPAPQPTLGRFYDAAFNRRFFWGTVRGVLSDHALVIEESADFVPA